MSKVSIIIPFYNCPYVDQAIKSALNQTYQDIEVIVINDGATKHSEKITPFLSRIRYLEKENGGTGSALNIGIQHATGDYIVWLSSDDIFESEKTEKQLNFMENFNAAICHSAYVQIDADNNIISKPMGVHYQYRLPFLLHMKQGCFINGCTVMLKREVLKHIGLFNESLLYTQDYDLWLRILKHYNFYYIDEPLIQYRIHEQMGTKKNIQKISQEIKLVKHNYRGQLDMMIQSLRSKSNTSI
ncbi:TPA: glycosyltransferase family 2 protein [Bacillus cereus]|nr:glycosyltransferase [Bacillus cereus]MDA1769697.1 glycosyltransferase [Bacillus cereus]